MVTDFIKQQKVFRPAVAMVELIFALVIMGIVLMSAPQLVSQAQSSGYVSTQQEAIAAASSHISFVLARHWDESNTDQTSGVTVLHTDTDTLAQNGLQSDDITRKRAGTPNVGIYHRTFRDSINGEFTASTPNTFGSRNDIDAGGGAETVNDDIDDFHNTEADLSFQNFVAGEDDYIDTRMVMNTQVRYIEDSPNNVARYDTNNDRLTFPLRDADFDGIADDLGRSSHVKYVRVVLTHDAAAGTPDDLNKSIVLEAFSCNIGEYKLEESDPL
ncbi:MAG: Unknown protein [uncultured Sulfurovum sp.]|uniref:Uncharacterized protein n=1 Tax=uncultured Sulfurovum sp. TaxID=269237 RepID=A0A6S6TLY4_9BACT|nr:MAG: Unknown protein [uncultured Sulfurovum sp.]